MSLGKAWLLILLAGAAAPTLAASAPADDATEKLLDRCLATAANASTAGQTDCEIAAQRDYDRRMNAAYTKLMRVLPTQAARQLRQSQRAWLAYRDSEAKARSALFATRQGTMYVPMEADAAMTLTRDRALMLESYVRIMSIS